MDDPENLERRLEALEQRIRDLEIRVPVTGDGRKPRPRHHERRGRIVLGIIVCAAGLLWLGQSYDIGWLSDLRFWPIAVILFGLFLILGE